MKNHVILPRPMVEKALGIKTSCLYQQMSDGLLPRPIKRSTRGVGWPSGEIEIIVQARISGASVDALRALTAGLVAARSTVAIPSSAPSTPSTPAARPASKRQP